MNRKSSNLPFWNLSRDIWVKGFIRQSSLYVNSVQEKTLFWCLSIFQVLFSCLSEKNRENGAVPHLSSANPGGFAALYEPEKAAGTLQGLGHLTSNLQGRASIFGA